MTFEKRIIGDRTVGDGKVHLHPHIFVQFVQRHLHAHIRANQVKHASALEHAAQPAVLVVARIPFVMFDRGEMF